MPKTCRTCDALQAYCHAAGVLPSGGGSFSCGLWNKRETPLLVDALVEALKAMLTLPYRPLRSSPQNATRINTIEARARAALARYKEEVDDDKMP